MTMTNNPTIDGVSRNAIEQALLAMKRIYQAGYDRILEAGGQCDTPEYMMAGDPTARELRALLDAGISASVKRQEPKPSQVPVLRSMAANYRNGHSWDFLDGEAVSKAADEITALQSTIARLEARITQLESEKEFAAATYQAARDRIADLESEEPEWSAMQQRLGDENAQLRDRIAELESGRGEQIGMLLIDEYFDNREIGEVDVQLDSEACEKLARDFPGRSLPVFVGPTALPERKPVTAGLLSESNTHNQGWNACLDATAALNGPTK